MKTSLKVIPTALIVGLISLFFADYANGSSVKPPGGRTGSVVDGGKTCMDNCHAGSVTPISTGISTDIPIEGYVAGQTYSITVGQGMGQPGVGTYGFEFSAQDSVGNLLGEFTPATGTVGYIPGKYIAHSSPQQASDPSWTFEWEAPSTGSGDVSFYLAVLAANGNGGNSGDEVLTTSSSVSEMALLGVTDRSSQTHLQVVLQANTVTVHYQNQTGQLYTVFLHDMNGILIYQGYLKLDPGSGSAKIKLNGIPSHGMHVLSLRNDVEQFTQKVLSQY
jgi:hypothetical protein